MADDATVSTEELLRQMSLARQAVENARQQAQLHVSAVLRGNEDRLDAFHSQAEAQQAESDDRAVVTHYFGRWASLPSHNSRARARLQRSVAHWSRKGAAGCFLAWARVARVAVRSEEAELRERLDAAVRQLGAGASPGGTDRRRVDDLTQEAQREMQATSQELEAALAGHKQRQAAARARQADAVSKLDAVEREIGAHEESESAAQSQLQRVRGDLELGATGRVREESYRGRTAEQIRGLLREAAATKEAELAEARDALDAVKYEEESQAASLQQAIRAESQEFRATESRQSALEERLKEMESRVPAARSQLEGQQRDTRDRQQQERDGVHAQLQEETHRRQTAEYRLDGLQSRLARVERDVAAAQASAADARDQMEHSAGQIQSGLVEQLAEHTMKGTAVEIEYETMQRTLEAKERDLMAALSEQKDLEIELVEQRERAEDEIIAVATRAKQTKARRDDAGEALRVAQAELESISVDGQQSEEELRERSHRLSERLHESSLARRSAELQLSQRERTLQSLQAKVVSARESLADEKQQLFRLKGDTKEEMLGQVCSRTCVVFRLLLLGAGLMRCGC